jgi:hypothetical protein
MTLPGDRTPDLAGIGRFRQRSVKSGRYPRKPAVPERGKSIDFQDLRHYIFKCGNFMTPGGWSAPRDVPADAGRYLKFQVPSSLAALAAPAEPSSKTRAAACVRRTSTPGPRLFAGTSLKLSAHRFPDLGSGTCPFCPPPSLFYPPERRRRFRIPGPRQGAHEARACRPGIPRLPARAVPRDYTESLRKAHTAPSGGRRLRRPVTHAAGVACGQGALHTMDDPPDRFRLSVRSGGPPLGHEGEPSGCPGLSAASLSGPAPASPAAPNTLDAPCNRGNPLSPGIPCLRPVSGRRIPGISRNSVNSRNTGNSGTPMTARSTAFAALAAPGPAVAPGSPSVAPTAGGRP